MVFMKKFNLTKRILLFLHVNYEKKKMFSSLEIKGVK